MRYEISLVTVRNCKVYSVKRVCKQECPRGKGGGTIHCCNNILKLIRPREATFVSTTRG